MKLEKNAGFNTDLFILKLNDDNVKRLLNIVFVMSVITLIQIILYSISSVEGYDFSLILTKALILIGGIIIITTLKLIKISSKFFIKYSQIIISVITFLIIMLAINNSFEAQRITSDISTYIIGLFIVVAAVRMKPMNMLIVQLLTFVIFAIGIPMFQPNAGFAFAHIANSLIINIVAYVINRLFYNYSMSDYIDKLDISEKNKELEYLSQIDGLTGLYNQRTIMENVAIAISKVEETKESLFVALLDLDGFKAINDDFGHIYGDEILKNVGETITDHIGSKDIAGRCGGDEFIVIFKGLDASAVKSRMQEMLDAFTNIEHKDNGLSFSCGVSKWQGETMIDLIDKADQLMYQVKRTGKSNIIVEQKG